MPDLKDGESTEMKGSGAKPYIIKNVGGVYSCTCPAWRNQSTGTIRTCKHIRKLRGDAAEEARLGGALSRPAPEKKVTAPPLLLAHTWTPDIDPTGWIMSEKLDGVRAWWDGENFISRLGNVYHAPDFFKEGLPKDTILDGELWLGRKKFQQCVSIVRRQDQNDEWKNIRYYVFDAPRAPGPFPRRLGFLNKLMLKHKAAKEFLMLLSHQPCKGYDDLKRYLKVIEEAGGEGVMLRAADSLYEERRSHTLLKVKSFVDAEATVIGYEAGKGKHKGRLGALIVKLPNGVVFALGTGFTDAERESPPPVGTTVTFRYQELSNTGVPRFPSFLRVRSE